MDVAFRRVANGNDFVREIATKHWRYTDDDRHDMCDPQLAQMESVRSGIKVSKKNVGVNLMVC